MNKNEQNKECQVCGDKAIARNFCALTCESCKAFFRRNANKLDQLKCIFGKQCEINLETRKSCRKCRLEKCYRIGMIKDCILNENEKKMRQVKIEENRKNKPITDICLKTTFLEPNDSNNYRIDSICLKSLQKLINENENELQINRIFYGNYGNNLNNSQNISQVIPISRQLTDYRNNFNEMEGNFFTELLDSTKKYFKIIVSEVTSEANTYLEAMRLISFKWEQEIRKLIKAVKNLRTFKGICKNDQVTLLKYGSVEIAFLRSVIFYEYENECWTVVLDENNAAKMKLEVLRQNDTLVEFFQSKLVITKLALEWDSDQIILHLLMVIVLFNPNRKNLIHRQSVKLQQKIYKHLLQRYLLLKYQSETESKIKYLKLIEILIDLRVLHERDVRTNLKERPPNFELFIDSPLLKELFDKKC